MTAVPSAMEAGVADPETDARAAAESDYANALAALTLPAQTTPLAPADPYGRTLTLVRGDFVLAAGDGGYCDLDEITGKDELAQGIQVLIGTNLGTDIFNTAFGFDLISTLAAPEPISQVKQLVRLCVVKALSQEPRIRQITAIAFVDDPNYLTIHPEVTAAEQQALIQQQRASRQWSLDVQFDTRLNDQVIAGIQGVGP
jgi:phage baseplate assembly protein W